MLVLIAALLAIISVPIYTRYFPVRGIEYVSLLDIDEGSVKLVDVRDYNQSYKDSIQGAINIPVAYFKRNFGEIPGQEIHIIVSSHVEKNISTRFLRRKGFKVTSYTLIDAKDELKKQQTRKEHSYGIQ